MIDTYKQLLHQIETIREHDYNADIKLHDLQEAIKKAEGFALACQQALDDKEEQGFIEHIQSHLEKGQVVVCRICGKQAPKSKREQAKAVVELAKQQGHIQ